MQHPLISDSSFSRWNFWLFRRWKLGSAIRKDELIDILQHLAKPPPEQPAGGGAESWDVALGKSLDKLDPQAAQDLVLVATEVKKLFPSQDAKVQTLMAPLMESAQSFPANIEKWFDSVMDRSSQRFAVHMRIWTVIFALLIALGLQLDAFSLFARVSSDAQLRASIIAGADALTKKADEILTVSTNGSSAIYVVAMRQMIASNTNVLKNLSEPVGFSSVAGGKEWLTAELKRANISNPEMWTKKFEDAVPQATLRAASEQLNTLLSNQLMVQLLPQPYPVPFYKNWSLRNRVFWGIIASAALLSLGAPFWFNVLKNLSNLRPLLAKKEEKESAAEQGS